MSDLLLHTPTRTARSLVGRLLRKLSLDFGRNDIESGLVPAPVYDDVGVFFGRLNVNAMHDLHRMDILVDPPVNIPAALGHVAAQTAQDALIGVGIRKDLDVKQLAQTLIVEGQDPVNDDDGRGAYASRLPRPRP